MISDSREILSVRDQYKVMSVLGHFMLILYLFTRFDLFQLNYNLFVHYVLRFHAFLLSPYVHCLISQQALGQDQLRGKLQSLDLPHSVLEVEPIRGNLHFGVPLQLDN